MCVVKFSLLQVLVKVKGGRCERRSELQQTHKRWQDGKYLVTISLYLDILTLIQKLGIAEHTEDNDTVKSITRIRYLIGKKKSAESD